MKKWKRKKSPEAIETQKFYKKMWDKWLKNVQEEFKDDET